MRTRRRLTGLTIFIAGVLLAAPGSVRAQAQFDHLKCYQIKDPLKLAAVVDLYAPDFGPFDLGTGHAGAKTQRVSTDSPVDPVPHPRLAGALPIVPGPRAPWRRAARRRG
jgi:hypothetical protein